MPAWFAMIESQDTAEESAAGHLASPRSSRGRGVLELELLLGSLGDSSKTVEVRSLILRG
ncbi:MAG: hypothetical protein ACI835_003394 [Planctomycetota bacterium]|jgi:hypothetical protein